MLKKIVISLLMLIMLTLPVLAEDQNQVVAVVKGENVTLGQLDAVINMNAFVMELYQMNPQFTQLLFTTPEGEQLLNAYRKVQLEQYIDQLVLVLEAKERGLTLSQEKIDSLFIQQIDQILMENNITEEQLLAALQQQGIQSLDEYKELFVQNSGDALLVHELQNQVVNSVTVSEEEAKVYYDENQANFVTEAAVHAKHVLVNTQEEAEEVLAKIKEGADFAQVAKDSSICPSAASGGDLGFISKGQTVAEFENAIFSMKAGEISEVVKTQYGYHVIKVEEIREASSMSFDSVKITLMQQLADKKKQEVWSMFAEELRQNTAVEIKL